MSRSPQDIYARHLLSRRGYPLWTPEPSRQLLAYRREGLRIGDVGVVIPEDGCFDVFFNICLPQDHPFHRATGVPDNFKPIQLSHMDIRTVDAENPGRIIANSSVRSARTVQRPAENSSRASSGLEYDEFSLSSTESRPRSPSGLEYEFTLSSSEGALLILPEGAERHDLRNHHLFLEMATQHGADWYRFVEERVGQIIGSDSLYLITGLHKTTSWSLAAFEKTAGTAEYPAQLRVSQADGNDVTATYTWDTTRALDWRVGPIAKYEIPNQSVFIRGFKIALRTGMFGTKWISVKADAPSTRPNPAKSVSAVSGDSWLAYVFGGMTTSKSVEPSRSGAQDEAAFLSELDDAREEIQNNGAIAVGEDVVIQRFPEASQAFHPSDIINRCLFNKEPSAIVAITHDDVWISILEEKLLQPGDLAQDGRLEALVSQKYDIVLEEGAVYLRGRGTSGLDTLDDHELAETTMGQELDPGGSDAMVTDVAPAAQQVHRELGLEASDAIIKAAPATPQVHLDYDRLTLQLVSPKGESTARQDSHTNLMVDPARTDLNPKTATDTLFSGTASRKLVRQSAHSNFQYCYTCGWVTGQAMCSLPVQISDFPEHMRSCHGVVGPDRTKLVCRWVHCSAEMKRESLTRHIIEKHLEVRYTCPHCAKQFTRMYTLQEHIVNKHLNDQNSVCITTEARSSQMVVGPSTAPAATWPEAKSSKIQDPVESEDFLIFEHDMLPGAEGIGNVLASKEELMMS